jgi:hypothetical protein
VLHPARTDIDDHRAIRVFNAIRVVALVAVIYLFVAAIA